MTDKAWVPFERWGPSGQATIEWGSVYEDAQRGELQQSCVRSLAWRMAAGTLSQNADHWATQTVALRSEYAILKEEAIVNPHDAPGDGHVVFDPLLSQSSNSSSTTTENPWRAFYQDKELLEDISQDLERLFPSGCGEFFTSPCVKSTLKNVLFLWAKLHEEVSYRQGMHELLAPIYFCFHSDAIHVKACKSLPREDFRIILDVEALEADVFWVFERVMQDMKALFVVSKHAAMSSEEIQQAKEQLIKDRKSGEMGSLATSSSMPSLRAQAPLTPILESGLYIQNTLLMKVDSELAQHLSALEVEPQLYALRWLRLLFAREFDMQDTLLLWDSLLTKGLKGHEHSDDKGGAMDEGITSSGPLLAKRVALRAQTFAQTNGDSKVGKVGNLACVFAVAMIKSIRSELLHSDYSGALSLLMRYPSGDRVTKLIEEFSKLESFAFPPQSDVAKAQVNRPASHQSKSMSDVQRSSSSMGEPRVPRGDETQIPARPPIQSYREYPDFGAASSSDEAHLAFVQKSMGDQLSSLLKKYSSTLSREPNLRKELEQVRNVLLSGSLKGQGTSTISGDRTNLA